AQPNLFSLPLSPLLPISISPQLLSVAGAPYDTMEEVIGLRGTPGHGSLKEFGVSYRQIEVRAMCWADAHTCTQGGSEARRGTARCGSLG
ncbi:unnamed protein product, partial [Closterium sp. NIES-53]